MSDFYFPHPTIPGVQVIRLLPDFVDAFKSRVEKLNKKLTKCVTGKGIRLVSFLSETPSVHNGMGLVDLAFWLPTYEANPNEELVSILSDKQGELMVMDLVDDFEGFGRKIVCDHCGENRRRNKAYLFRNRLTGKITSVGSTCVDDFYGLSMMKALEAWEKFILDIVYPSKKSGNGEEEEYIGSRSWGKKWFGHDINRTIACAYVAHKKAKIWSSGKPVFFDYLHRDVKDGEQEILNNSAEIAPIVAYFRSEEFRKAIDVNQSFGQNIYNAFFYNDLPKPATNHAGLIGFSVFHHLNKKQEVTVSDLPESNWVGTVGGKVELSLTVIRSRRVESGFGISTLYACRDEQGNDVTFFMSGSWSPVIGGAIKVTGKVKNHGDYKGRKQTTLYYVKIKD